MRRDNIIIGCMGVLLLSSVATGVYMRHIDEKAISELELQIDELEAQEKQSAVDRRVSKQMEQIAYGQEILAEERSKEAVRQSEIAEEMRLRSESERRRALAAQGVAELSAREAKHAYELAEQQRVEAEAQRGEAEHAKLVADTLNYISLGRNLGAQSYSVYQAGDTEIGNMLAYASYLYTRDYGGDFFVPAVFQALTQSAGGRRNFSVHNGSVSCTRISLKDNHLLTTSTYGEMFRHEMAGRQLQTRRLVSDRGYCFRDGLAGGNGKDYAISHTGHLVVADESGVRVIYLEGVDRPFNLQEMKGGEGLLIVGEKSVAVLDMKTERVVSTRRLPFRVVSTGRRGGRPLLFDDGGRMHEVKNVDDMSSEKVPVAGQTTAFAEGGNGLAAYGMGDGTIWLTDGGGKVKKLVEHLSQVTKLEFDAYRLYSSSLDGKLLVWMTTDSQIMPITLFQSNSWLHCFTFSKEMDYIWTGEHNGTVTEYLISLPKITQRLRQNVKRNFTQEEWNYYVGKGIPYRRLKTGD